MASVAISITAVRAVAMREIHGATAPNDAVKRSSRNGNASRTQTTSFLTSSPCSSEPSAPVSSTAASAANAPAPQRAARPPRDAWAVATTASSTAATALTYRSRSVADSTLIAAADAAGRHRPPERTPSLPSARSPRIVESTRNRSSPVQLFRSGTVASMARTLKVRLDERAEQDLALLRNEGHNDSDAIRLALREAAERRRRRSAVRLEAEQAASDPDDLAEARTVLAQMHAPDHGG